MADQDEGFWLNHILINWRHSCRNLAFGCFVFWLLFVAAVCSLLFFLFRPHSAGAATTRFPLAVWLLIDNSNSSFEMGGVGSDPNLLRIDAARLFLTYLGVDEPGLTHQAGVIFFGSRAETAVPLTPLTDDEQRAQLFAQIANPPRMGWTDHLAALTLAQEQLASPIATHRPVVILLSDGKPEWAQDPPAEEQTAYITALRQKSQELAEAGIPLFIILLANEATDADPDITAIWRPLWQEMSAAHPTGRFYVARTAAQLPDIYHDIVVTLTGRQTAGVVLDTAVSGHSRQTLEIPAGLAQMTLVIRKDNPTQTITIQTPGQVTLADDSPFARHAGGRSGDGDSREEIWVIEQPSPGTWTLQLDGSGRITIWQDYLPAPTPVPAPTALATATIKPSPVPPTPVSTLAASATTTPSPTATNVMVAPAIPLEPPLTQPPDTPAPTSAPASRWPWAVAGIVLTGGGTAVLYWRRQRQRPCVTGLLRLADGHTTIDLDGLNRPVVTVGQPPADVPIPGATTRAILQTGVPLGGEYEIVIRGNGDLRVNGRPVTGEMNLADTAVIHLGNGVQARYENLRLRRAWREAGSGEQ